MANVFEKWARFVARRPWTVVMLSFFLAGSLSAGMSVMQSTGEASILWSIRTRGYDDDQYMIDFSGEDQSFLQIFCERVGATAGSTTPSIFDDVAIVEMHKLRNWTMQELEVIDPKTGTAIKFDDICARSIGDDGAKNGGPCSSASAGITLQGPNNGVASDLAVSSWDVAGVKSLYDISSGFAIKKVSKHATLDSNDHLVSSSALVSMLMILLLFVSFLHNLFFFLQLF